MTDELPLRRAIYNELKDYAVKNIPHSINNIVELLNKNHYLSINELMKQTGIAKSTLRRDLFELETQGKLIRARGGARLPDTNVVIAKSAYESPFTARRADNQEEKIRIAEAAMQCI